MWTATSAFAQDSVERRLRNADFFLGESRGSEALMELQAAERLVEAEDPYMIWIHERMGAIFLSQHDFSKAREHYLLAVKLAKRQGHKGARVAAAYEGLGRCELETSAFGRAVEAAALGLEAGPGAEARQRLAALRERAIAEERISHGSAFAGPSAPPVRVSRVVFLGNRTDERTLRRLLPFSEGELIAPGSLEKARDSLYALQLFKKVAVSSAAAAHGGAEVTVALRDGWYLIPFPFYQAGSGGSRGGLYLAARNIFRRAESFSGVGVFGRSGSHVSVGAGWEEWGGRLSFERKTFTERRYVDGAFSFSSGLGDPGDQGREGRFPAVAASYVQRVESGGIAFSFPLWRGGFSGLSGELEWDYALVRYDGSRTPADSGHQSQAVARLRFGGGGGGGGDLGVLLGFGLADMEERLRPLHEPRWGLGGGFSYGRGGGWTGSDFNYGVLRARLTPSVTWGLHRRLTLDIEGGSGDGLTFHRLISTGRDTAMQGAYAREHRGSSGIGAGLTYSHPFRITRLGIWQGVVFMEGARTWMDEAAGSKIGAGGGFWYRFWRFPIPLGLTLTRSIDDDDWQITGAVGGRF